MDVEVADPHVDLRPIGTLERVDDPPYRIKLVAHYSPPSAPWVGIHPMYGPR
jgi:hypothetical protein